MTPQIKDKRVQQRVRTTLFALEGCSGRDMSTNNQIGFSGTALAVPN